jgi:2-keto-4-pentenoate hydratase/2-oxohepta-3-ene-1,7-dioic acid hydratase in catechol pathway
MKFARLGLPGEERAVVLVEGVAHTLDGVTADLDAAFWESGGPGRVRAALAAGQLERLPGADALRIGAPGARPGAIYCIGMNYAAHAAESGAEPPAQPVVFLKVPNSVAGPDDDVTIPRGSEKTDWEVELGIVIGTRASYLDSPEEGFAHVGGYVLANDLSERAFQLEVSGGQWSKGKIAAGFTPLGPWLVTADEVAADQLGLRSWVNGEARQNSSSADMIFGVGEIVHHLSQYAVLDPGDVILTGTPQGVALSGRFPYLAPGDVVEVEIDGLGRQRQRMHAWEGDN